MSDPIPQITSGPLNAAHPDAFRMAVQSVRDYAIFLLDPKGHILSWNPGAEIIKGYKAEEIIGRHFSAFYLPESIASGWPDEELARASQYGRLEDQGWRLRKDGRRFWADVVITALRDQTGTLLGFAKITRDMTDNREQTESLRQSEERFRLMVERVKDYAIFMLDLDGNVASWNAGAEHIKGYRAEEIIGRHFSSFYTPEAIAAHWPEYELTVARDRGRFEDEGWRLRKDGTRFWANVVLTAIYDRTGILRGYAKITRDLTDARRMRELEESGKRLSEFLAMLSHELRNPLAPISMAARLINPESEPEVLRKSRDMIERQAAHMTHLVDDLLDVQRITSGKIVLQKQDVNMHAVVGQAVESVRTLLDERRHTLELELGDADNPIHVSGDYARLVQVVVNLLSNAAKYTPSGGRIRCVMARDGNDLSLTVSDNGIGIAPQFLPHVFELFTQASHGGGNTGLGVGLHLARRMMELHGGTLTARSAGLQQGSVFRMALPALPAGHHIPPPRSDQPPPRAAGLRVLVVDDNRDAAESTAMVLRAMGCSAETCDNALAALDMMRRYRPDAVLMDLGMPDLNGYEVVSRMRADLALAQLPVAAISGYAQADHLRQSREAGFDAHFAKPVDFEALQAFLAGVASRRGQSVHARAD